MTPFDYDWGTAAALWKRDLLRLKKERSRWLGVLAQPVLFWVIIGSGMSEVFHHAAGRGDYLGFFYPGILAMIVLFTTIFSTISLIEDRQSGFLQGVLTGPGSRAAVVAGKTAGVASVVLFQTTLFLLLAPAAGFPFLEIHWVSLMLAVVLGCVALTGLTFTMAWILPSSQAYHAIMSVILIPLWIVSGAMFPVPHSWLGWIMRVNPMTYIVDAFRNGLGRQTAPTILGEYATIGVLACFALAAFVVAVYFARKDKARTP